MASINHEPLTNIKFDSNGLIPAIVQDAKNKDVLMLAYMNAESLQKTIQSGETWFWSRSRQELWHKGATSGNTQKVVDIRYDCDGDTLLVLVEPAGPACHTGAQTCFFRSLNPVATNE
jgi:phosphoribosyl-ATP pyrophosphohydrolase/phosphoribosyl-AMP cyclohydrolase